MGNSIRRMEIVGFEDPGIESNYLLNVEILEFINPDGTPYSFAPPYQPIYDVRRGEWDPSNTYLAGDPLKGETTIFGGGTPGEVAYQYLWQKRNQNAGETSWTNIGTWVTYDNTTIMVEMPQTTEAGYQYKLLSRARDASVDPVDVLQRATGIGGAKLISAQPFAKDTSWINVTPNSGGQTVNVGDTITYTTATYEPDGGTPGYTSYEYYWRLETGNGTNVYEEIDPPGKTDYNNTAINVSFVVPAVASDGTRRIGPRTRAEDSAPYGAANASELGTAGIMQFIAAYTPVFVQTPATWVTPLNGSTVGDTITATGAIFGGGNANTTYEYRWQYIDENDDLQTLPANVVDAQYIGWKTYDNLGGQISLPLTLTSTTSPLFNGEDWFANKKIALRFRTLGNGETQSATTGQNLINPAPLVIQEVSVWDSSNVYEVGETISIETAVFSGGTPYPLPGENGNVWEVRWQVRPDENTSYTLLSGPDYWTGPEDTTKSLLLPPEANDQQLRALNQVRDRSNNPPTQDVKQEARPYKDITGPPIVTVSAPDYSVNGELNTGEMTTAQTVVLIPGTFSGGYGTLITKYRWRYKVGGAGNWINQPWQFSLPLSVDGDNALLSVGDIIQLQQRVDDELGTFKTSTATPFLELKAATTIGTLSIAPPSTSANAGDTITFDALISGDADPDYTWSIRSSGPATFVGGNTGSQVQVQVNAGTASGTSITIQCDAVDDEASDSPKSTASIIVVN